MITYPVDVANGRFTFKLGVEVRRNQRWPRADGGPIDNADPSLIILEESIAANPAFNPATHKLDNGTWVDDEQNQTATFTRTAVPLTQAELDENASEAGLTTKRTGLVNQIATLRTWAADARNTTVTSGNAVAVLQTIVNRLGVFFDKFADLLEVERYQ